MKNKILICSIIILLSIIVSIKSVEMHKRNAISGMGDVQNLQMEISLPSIETSIESTETVVETTQEEIITSQTTVKKVIVKETTTKERTTLSTTTESITTEPLLDVNLEENLVYYDIPISTEDQDFIREVCNYYGFSPKLIYQIMYRESSFNRFSDNGTCKGLMQIHKSYYKGYLESNDGFSYIYAEGFDFYNVRHNTLIGIRMLNGCKTFCLNRNINSISAWLQCYNQGVYGYLNNPGSSYAARVLSTNIKIK